MAHHNQLGDLGEALAIDLLQRKGYTIRERNYRFGRAEIDIIAETADLLVVVEVKTRNSDFFGDPQSFITPGKIRQVVKAADHYLNENGIEKEVRFDVVAVLKNSRQEQLTHFEDAFYHF